MRAINRILAGAALLASATGAQSGAPSLAEDAGVLGAGACEVEAGWARVRDAPGSVRETAVGLACGTPLGWQWGVGLARASGSGATAKGLVLGGKITLRSLADDASVALAPALGWVDDGTGWRAASQELNLVYSGPLATDWTLHLNLGHSRDRDADQRSTTWALALEHGELDFAGLTLAPMGDVSGDDRGAPWWNVGLRATLVAERAWLGLSYARQIDRQRARLATLSLKFAF